MNGRKVLIRLLQFVVAVAVAVQLTAALLINLTGTAFARPEAKMEATKQSIDQQRRVAADLEAGVRADEAAGVPVPRSDYAALASVRLAIAAADQQEIGTSQTVFLALLALYVAMLALTVPVLMAIDLSTPLSLFVARLFDSAGRSAAWLSTRLRARRRSAGEPSEPAPLPPL